MKKFLSKKSFRFLYLLPAALLVSIILGFMVLAFGPGILSKKSFRFLYLLPAALLVSIILGFLVLEFGPGILVTISVLFILLGLMYLTGEGLEKFFNYKESSVIETKNFMELQRLEKREYEWYLYANPTTADYYSYLSSTNYFNQEHVFIKEQFFFENQDLKKELEEL